MMILLLMLRFCISVDAVAPGCDVIVTEDSTTVWCPNS